jgi:exopolysaccharide/PEP-CTERM locus tyrosine autokinase
MSLIERAVTRLGGNPPVFPQPEEPGVGETGAVASEPKLSSIERLMEREPDRVTVPTARPAEKPAADNGSTAARAPAAPGGPAAPAAARGEAPVHIRLDSLRQRGFIVPDTQATRTGEEFRVIKRPLIANAFGTSAAPVRNGKRVMITSAFPGEGKSFCAINLALSIAAERDHKVLLVDADVARPSIPRELGFQAGAGLMDWLLDPTRLDVADLVLQTDVEKLAILPSGRRHEHATELLASQGMSNFLDLLTTRFPDRLIIFDSPPLLVTTESRVLATYMGQIVLVVEAGRTPKAAVAEAISTIEGASEVVGVVLNKSSGNNTGGYGYYGYGYGYGYGNGRAKPPSA